MKAKEYLQQLQRLDTVINQKIKEVDDLRLKSRSVGSIDYSKERVQTSPSGDAPFVKLIGRIIDLEEEINAEIAEYLKNVSIPVIRCKNFKQHQIIFNYIEKQSTRKP